jgi:hypothetical protein
LVSRPDAEVEEVIEMVKADGEFDDEALMRETEKV